MVNCKSEISNFKSTMNMKKTLSILTLALMPLLGFAQTNGGYTSVRGAFWANASTVESVSDGGTNWVAIPGARGFLTTVDRITLTTVTNKARLQFLTPIAAVPIIATNLASPTNLIVNINSTNTSYTGKYGLFYGAASNVWALGWIANGSAAVNVYGTYTNVIKIDFSQFNGASNAFIAYVPKAGDTLYVLQQSATIYPPSGITNLATAGLCNSDGGFVGATWEPAKTPIFVSANPDIPPIVCMIDPVAAAGRAITTANTNWIQGIAGRLSKP
jgi:hypothetical protein